MPEAPGRARALPVLGGLGALWGASFLFIKVILDDTGPLELAFGRLFLGAVAVLAYMAVRRLPLRFTPFQVAQVAAMSVVNNVIPFLLIAWGETHITSGTASVLNATMPIFTAVVAAAVFAEERFTAARLLGLLLGLAGVIVLTGDDVVHITDSNVLGQLAVIGAAACYGTGSNYARVLLRGTDPVALAALQLASATLILLPPLLIVDGVPDYPLSAEGWGSLLTLGLAGTGIAYIAYLWLIENLGSVRASLVTYIIPPVGLVLGWLLLDEHVGLGIILGAALIIVGVAAVLRRPAPATERRAEEAAAEA